MFYIGSNVLDWPLEAQRGLTDGHEMCALSLGRSLASCTKGSAVLSSLGG